MDPQCKHRGRSDWTDTGGSETVGEVPHTAAGETEEGTPTLLTFPSTTPYKEAIQCPLPYMDEEVWRRRTPCIGPHPGRLTPYSPARETNSESSRGTGKYVIRVHGRTAHDNKSSHLRVGSFFSTLLVSDTSHLEGRSPRGRDVKLSPTGRRRPHN